MLTKYLHKHTIYETLMIFTSKIPILMYIYILSYPKHQYHIENLNTIKDPKNNLIDFNPPQNTVHPSKSADALAMITGKM